MIRGSLLFTFSSYKIMGFTHTKHNLVKQPVAKCAWDCHLERVGLAFIDCPTLDLTRNTACIAPLLLSNSQLGIEPVLNLG